MKKYVALYRVSTTKQEQSHLGLDAQQLAIESYVKSVGGTIIKAFTEVQSGGNKDRISIGETPDIHRLLSKRPILQQAVELALKEGATLVVKEASRLSRFSLLINHFLAKSLDFVSADSPNDNPLMIRIKTALNEEELIKVSERTRAALAPRVGTGQLGNPSLHKVRQKATANSVEVRKKKALLNENNRRAVGYITSLRNGGMTFAAIADTLNSQGFKTSRGGNFSSWSVQVLYNRSKELKQAA